MLLRTVLSFFLYLFVAYGEEVDLNANPPQYGVDCSFPIHRGINKDQCPFWHKVYHDRMKGCYKAYSQKECEDNENGRMEMNLAQPRGQHNYTQIGFKHMKIPANAWEPLIEFYNKFKGKEKLEKWYRGNTIVNNWESPSYMISFEEAEFKGGLEVKAKIWEAMRPVIEEWVGHKVEPTSLYGIRIYKENAVLATHVDRLPLVSSAIINVDQDIDEDWPVEVYDHAGKAYNVSMSPGDIVLYESHTILHGRPFPLKGRYYANVFVHYQPIDHDEMNEKDEEERRRLFPNLEPLSVKRRHGDKRSLRGKKDLPADIMVAASQGRNDELRRLLNDHSDLVNFTDANKWQPLHEAVRGGHLETVMYLVAMGAEIGSRVKGGDNALDIARKHLPEGHEVIDYLIEIGVEAHANN